MANINENYLNLQGSYLFANIAKKVADYQAAHPDADIIRLGIGDVTLPLVPAIIDAMSKAVQEWAKLKRSAVTVLNKVMTSYVKLLLMAITNHQAQTLRLMKYLFPMVPNPTLVTSKNYSAKTTSSLLLIQYTQYTQIPTLWAVRTGEAVDGIFQKVVYLPTYAENNFSPEFPSERVDIVYLCSPNNQQVLF